MTQKCYSETCLENLSRGSSALNNVTEKLKKQINLSTYKQAASKISDPAYFSIGSNTDSALVTFASAMLTIEAVLASALAPNHPQP